MPRLVATDPPRRLDPAAWGGDHVGQPVPEYATGDQCLFCHRGTVGATWEANRHNRTVRPFEAGSPAHAALLRSPARDLVQEIRLVLGDGRRQRFLKPAAAYGRVEILSVEWVPPREGKPGRLLGAERPRWDAAQFGDACAGCHATAVDPKERTFSSLSLDCYTCHGNPPAEHTARPGLALLSPKGRAEPRVVASLCAQCHVRTGTAKRTGRPYPTHFVPGDNLFRDFRVDFSDRALSRLSTADRHLLENVRDVAVLGKEQVTCLSCHDIHAGSSKKHAALPRTAYCGNCHQGSGPMKNLKPLSNHSRTCGY